MFPAQTVSADTQSDVVQLDCRMQDLCCVITYRSRVVSHNLKPLTRSSECTCVYAFSPRRHAPKRGLGCRLTTYVVIMHDGCAGPHGEAPRLPRVCPMALGYGLPSCKSNAPEQFEYHIVLAGAREWDLKLQ